MSRALVVDLFCGGGGASEGIRLALGRAPDVAVNHDPAAIAMHEANHPDTIHLCRDVIGLRCHQLARGQRVGLLWLSPDCTHHSRARGGKPREQKIRDLANVAIPWAEQVRPAVIGLENVAEFLSWGPLDEEGQPIPERAGEHFEAWVARLRSLGYVVEWRVLTACDYGAPTSRERLILIARCDGLPIVWPEPAHGPGLLPYRVAGDCIDWSVPAPSIFERKRKLADNTEHRIAEGLRRYVIENPTPWVVNGERVAALVQSGWGERPGQRMRTLDIRAPIGTIVAGGVKHALVEAWIVKNYTGVFGHAPDRPLGTITARDHHGLGVARLIPGIERVDHADMVGAFLVKYYGSAVGQRLDEPLHTIVSKARFGLCTVHLQGEPYTVVDIGYRMLRPHELAVAQGLGPDYTLTGTQAEQIARIGNSVPPQLVAAVVGANVPQDQDGEPDLALFRAAAK